jgi:hypothetical protein
MCMDLFERSAHVHLLAGYESGRTILRIISGDKTATIWAAQAHTAPGKLIQNDLIHANLKSSGILVFH